VELQEALLDVAPAAVAALDQCLDGLLEAAESANS
jgi:hypothetical protein